jgi:hypothetical protein
MDVPANQAGNFRGSHQSNFQADLLNAPTMNGEL